MTCLRRGRDGGLYSERATCCLRIYTEFCGIAFPGVHFCAIMRARSGKGNSMNRVPLGRQVQIINCLVEGNSIRSTEGMTGTHRDTICRLLVEIGDGCAKLMDEQMRELPCRRIEVDEIWAYVGKKQRHMTEDDDPRRVGDQYTFVALDTETKLVPSYLVGKRDLPTATAFIADLSERLANRVQLSSDALAAYVEATERAFGADIDYGQIHKFYEAEPVGRGRYSPPHVVGAERTTIVGNPDPAHINTSYIERQNLTMRMSMRRFTRLTNAFSKKVENLQAAVSLHFAHYNFVRVHRTLRVTPAMEARVSDRLWSLDELVERASG
jgi:IS1 family transposase